MYVNTRLCRHMNVCMCPYVCIQLCTEFSRLASARFVSPTCGTCTTNTANEKRNRCWRDKERYNGGISCARRGDCDTSYNGVRRGSSCISCLNQMKMRLTGDRWRRTRGERSLLPNPSLIHSVRNGVREGDLPDATQQPYPK